jgi:hypothetical protein
MGGMDHRAVAWKTRALTGLDGLESARVVLVLPATEEENTMRLTKGTQDSPPRFV